MIDKEEIIRIREQVEDERKLSLEEKYQRRIDDFRVKCEDVIEKLDIRIRGAAIQERLELVLIEVSSEVVDMDKINNRGFDPYQNKTVVKHPMLIELWEKIESRNLLPIFIHHKTDIESKVIFGVQLPDGGQYPRQDSVAEVWNRMFCNRWYENDYYFNEDGTYSIPTIDGGVRHVTLVKITT